MTSSSNGRHWLLGVAGLKGLVTSLSAAGYRVLGPLEKEGAIVYGEIESPDGLPRGIRDEQTSGKYRIRAQPDDTTFFSYVPGPHSWKRFLFPSSLKLFTSLRSGRGFKIEYGATKPEKLAFLGVRPCEIAAIQIQDKVFTDGPYADTHYRSLRSGTFIVAVQCGEPGGTCFCASMGTGPRAANGFDIALTELARNGDPEYLAESGSDDGTRLLEAVPGRPALESEWKEALDVSLGAQARMGRSLDAAGMQQTLRNSAESPNWELLAKRCLSCANCTLVCPTCFCHTIDDVTDLSGVHAERIRKWDSCFTLDFSYIHGGSIRRNTASRYRQWMTHKLSSWHDQFGTPGCVGCGRCITWCPAGIDITHEASLLQEKAREAQSSRE